MRKIWMLGLIGLAGCSSQHILNSENPPTQQVAASLQEPRKAMPTRVSYAPASQDASYRVLQIKDRLIGQNPQVGIKPYINAIGSGDPEVFHVGLNQIYITEGLIRQCQSEGQLAAVIANELGQMVSEREAAVSDDVRQSRPLPPIHLPIGNGNESQTDPFYGVEMARYEKKYPRQHKKLGRPNPQQVARDILEHAGYQRTDLDAAWPILQNAERNHNFQGQFTGSVKQADWKTP